MSKPELIKEIVKETKVDGEKYFDSLNDKTKPSLEKYLKIIKLLKK